MYTTNGYITTAKLLFNSVISTKNAKFIGVDLKYFLLKHTNGKVCMYENTSHNNTTRNHKKYNITQLIDNGFILAKIIKGTYGLPQVGWLAYGELVKHLSRYEPMLRIPGLFTH